MLGQNLVWTTAQPARKWRDDKSGWLIVQVSNSLQMFETIWIESNWSLLGNLLDFDFIVICRHSTGQQNSGAFHYKGLPYLQDNIHYHVSWLKCIKAGQRGSELLGHFRMWQSYAVHWWNQAFWEFLRRLKNLKPSLTLKKTLYYFFGVWCSICQQKCFFAMDPLAAKERYDIDIDYMGLWNEMPWGLAPGVGG